MGLRFKVDKTEAIYFITTTAVDFQPVLTQSGIPEILYDSLEFYRIKYAFRLNAYVIMPHHIHLLIHIDTKTNISDIMDFKKYTSVQIHKQIKLHYIHENPMRAGLVSKAEDYPFSSAGFYLTGETERIRIDEIRW